MGKNFGILLEYPKLWRLQGGSVKTGKVDALVIWRILSCDCPIHFLA